MIVTFCTTSYGWSPLWLQTNIPKGNAGSKYMHYSLGHLLWDQFVNFYQILFSWYLFTWAIITLMVFICTSISVLPYMGHDKLIIILGFVFNKLKKKRSSTFDVEPKPMIDTLGPLEASCEQLGSLDFGSNKARYIDHVPKLASSRVVMISLIAPTHAVILFLFCEVAQVGIFNKKVLQNFWQ